MIELLEQNKCSSGLDNDFSNVYYITNNLQRSEQAQAELARDMRAQKVSAIIPPSFMPYRLAFLTIADNIINSSYNISEITEYNEDWIQFFIYKLAVDVIKPVKGEADYFFTNRRHNIVSDFDKFIADVINHVKWGEALKIKPAGGEPEEYFLQVLKKYLEAGSAHKGSRFFSALMAYKQLYEYLSVPGKINGFNKTLIVEDLEDMEPVFQDIVRMLDKLGVTVKTVRSCEPQAKPGTGARNRVFYNFMTPLDEAETVGFRIKQLLSKGVADNEIVVVPYNSTSAELIDLVFHRFGIRSSRVSTLSSSRLFKLFKSAVYAARYPDENAEEILSLLDSDCSSCRVTRNTYKWVKKRISKQGRLIHKKPLETVKTALEKTVSGSQEYLAGDGQSADAELIASIKFDIEAVKKVLDMTCSGGSGSISSLLQKAIDTSTPINRDVLNILSESAIFMDETLSAVTNPADYKFMLDALFSALSGREYFEQLDPKKEARQFINELNAYDGGAFFIPVMDALSADNIKAKHIFLFGLDASFDRQEVLRYPGILAKTLGIPGHEQRKALKYRKLMNAINSGADIHMSYAYLSLEGRVEGMSNMARMAADDKTRAAYPELSGFKVIINADNSLIRSFDIIEKENQAPDISYTYAVDPKGAKFGSADKRDAMLAKTQIKEILITDEKRGKKIVSVTDFVKYIQCPRNFVFNLLARKTGLIQPDLESRARMDKGTFWHAVYQLAGSEFISDFNGNKAGIKKAVLNSFDKVLSKYEPEVFDEAFKDDFISDAKGIIIPTFVDNEVKRREMFKGLAVVHTEFKLSITLDADTLLEGKADRIDRYDEGVIFWDYKTGNKPPDKMQLLLIKGESAGLFRPGYHGAYAIQLIAYLVMAEKMNMAGLDGIKLAGLIGLKGHDNLEEFDAIAAAYPAARAKMEEAIKEFGEKFINKNIMEIETSDGCESGFAAPPVCKRCDFEPVCSILSLKEVQDDKEDN